MDTRTNGIRLATAVAALLFVGVGTAGAQEPTKATPTPADAQVCTVKLDPQAVQIQAEPVQLKASLSQAIGAGVVAAIQEEGSGVEVAVAPAPDAAGKTDVTTPNPAGPAPKEPPVGKPSSSSTGQPAPTMGAAGESVALTLNTQAAKAGEYTLSLKGETGACTGKFTVQGAPK
ncbi:MAG TPA: hypothetical protein VFQ38_08455 [Longimicrobiales bacterium]|nr:hypothetical protein [Longimicrobiales bacterium]